MRNLVFRAVCLLAFVSFSLNGYAQGPGTRVWRAMCEWIEEEGAEYLASYAHPNDSYEGSYVVSSNSNRIVVEIRFESFLHYYTSRYEINRGDDDDLPYFQNVIQLENGTTTASFRNWNSYSRYSRKYNEMELDEVYGRSRFSDLTKGRMAAAALQIEFLEYLQ